VGRESHRHLRTGAAYLAAYAWILASLGREQEARAQLSATVAGGFASLPFDANWLSGVAEAGEAALLLVGHAAAVLGRRDEAIAHYEAAIRIDAAAGFTPWADRARHALNAVRGESA
jgi:tetratricopeptide (TPR) repeat protein